jgi:putative two-component system response regulator
MANTRQLIMLVDDNRTNLLTGKTALSEEYTVLTVPSAAKMFEAVEWRKPDLILLDVDMPVMNGFEAIQILKKQPNTQDIPVIFLTALNESSNELEGLHLGAIDYITKPFSPPLLRQRIAIHLLVEKQKRQLKDYNDNLQAMVEAKTKTILKLQNKILAAMAEMVEGRDGVTGDHIANTEKYLKSLLRAAIDSKIWEETTSDWDVDLIAQSSQLHDVGKICVSDRVLKKPGRLTPEEFEEMKKHVIYGVDFIEKLEDGAEDTQFLQYAKTFAQFHHEKFNGSGYPAGVAGDKIPLLGRMLAIVDVYDALTSQRPYKKALTHDEAVDIIIDSKGTHFDPQIVELFEIVSKEFPK